MSRPHRMKFHEGVVERREDGTWEKLWMVMKDNVLFLFNDRDVHEINTHIGTLHIDNTTQFERKEMNHRSSTFVFELKTKAEKADKIHRNKFKTNKMSDMEIWRTCIMGIAKNGAIPTDIDLPPQVLSDIQHKLTEYLAGRSDESDSGIHSTFENKTLDSASLSNKSGSTFSPDGVSPPALDVGRRHKFESNPGAKYEVPSWFFNFCTRDKANDIFRINGDRFGNTLMRESSVNSAEGSYVITYFHKRKTDGSPDCDHFKVIRTVVGFRLEIENDHKDVSTLSDVMNLFVEINGKSRTMPMRINNLKELNTEESDYRTFVKDSLPTDPTRGQRFPAEEPTPDYPSDGAQEPLVIRTPSKTYTPGQTREFHRQQKLYEEHWKREGHDDLRMRHPVQSPTRPITQYPLQSASHTVAVRDIRRKSVPILSSSNHSAHLSSPNLSQHPSKNDEDNASSLKKSEVPLNSPPSRGRRDSMPKYKAPPPPILDSEASKSPSTQPPDSIVVTPLREEKRPSTTHPPNFVPPPPPAPAPPPPSPPSVPPLPVCSSAEDDTTGSVPLMPANVEQTIALNSISFHHSASEPSFKHKTDLVVVPPTSSNPPKSILKPAPPQQRRQSEPTGSEEKGKFGLHHVEVNKEKSTNVENDVAGPLVDDSSIGDISNLRKQFEKNTGSTPSGVAPKKPTDKKCSQETKNDSASATFYLNSDAVNTAGHSTNDYYNGTDYYIDTEDYIDAMSSPCSDTQTPGLDFKKKLENLLGGQSAVGSKTLPVVSKQKVLTRHSPGRPLPETPRDEDAYEILPVDGNI